MSKNYFKCESYVQIPIWNFPVKIPTWINKQETYDILVRGENSGSSFSEMTETDIEQEGRDFEVKLDRKRSAQKQANNMILLTVCMIMSKQECVQEVREDNIMIMLTGCMIM